MRNHTVTRFYGQDLLASQNAHFWLQETDAKWGTLENPSRVRSADCAQGGLRDVRGGPVHDPLWANGYDLSSFALTLPER